MSTKELRVAVVGAGRWSERAHIPGWQRDPRVEVAAVADVDAEVAGRVAKEFGVARVVTDYRELLDDPVDRRDRRGHRQRGPLPGLLGRARGGQARAVREARAPRRPADQAGRRAGRGQGPEDQARLHLPLRAGGDVRQGPDRPGLRRRARTSSTATSRTASGSTRRRRCARPRGPSRTAPRSPCPRSRATARRSSTSCTGGSAAR